MSQTIGFLIKVIIKKTTAEVNIITEVFILKEIFDQCINFTNMSQDCQVVTLDRNIYETNRLISYLQAIRHRLFTTFTETHRNTSECFD